MSLILFPGFNQKQPVIGLACFIWLSLSSEDNVVNVCQQLAAERDLNVFIPGAKVYQDAL